MKENEILKQRAIETHVAEEGNKKSKSFVPFKK